MDFSICFLRPWKANSSYHAFPSGKRHQNAVHSCRLPKLSLRSTGQHAALNPQALSLGLENIHFYTLPGNYGDSVKGLSYVSINIEEWLQMVNDCLNPYDQDVTEANVNILVHSYTTGFYSTTGYIAGGKDSFYDNTGASG